MRNFRIFFIILISLILQTTLCPVFRFGSVTPNLVLIAVVLAGTHLGTTRGMWIGAFTGIFMDSLSGERLGPYLLAYALCGLIAGRLAKYVYHRHWLSPLVSTLVGTLIEGLVIGIWDGHGEFLLLMGRILLPGILYNGIVSIPASEILYYFLQPLLPEITVSFRE